MSLAIRFMAEPVREVAFGVLGAPYSTLGGPMQHPIRFFLLQNFTDVGVMVSFDGVNDHIPMVTNGYFVPDISGNKTIERGFFLAEGQQLYVRHLALPATSGSVWLSVFYGAEV